MNDGLRLFDDIERQSITPAGYSEPRFNFLNRTAEPQFGYIRELIQGWFDNFHASSLKRQKVWKEFRSTDDRVHLSAFFEIYLYELMKNLNFSIIVEPEWDFGSPDFLLEAPTGEKILLEATGCYPEKEFGLAKQREKRVIDALNNTLHSPDFFLHMRINSAPVGDPPFGKIRKYIEKALSKLNPDEVTQQVESADNKGFERFPLIIWEHESWNIEFRAIPKKREARGKPNVRPIGSMFYDFSFRDDISPIRASIDSKYAKYGTLEIPYVLALNAVDLSISEADVSSALFGSELGIYDFVTHHLEYTRKPDGAWYGPNGYQKKRMSGLLVFYRLQPELMHMIIPTLWHHPYANNPLKPHLFHLNQLVPNEITEILDLVSGRDVCSILGIDAEKMPH